ncbi:hypothetical protein SteCoe_1397 [Stentor coeruleus]|uniref:Transmembrane 9 superfamily member n=1 Tax=Stentor coeruleus TaxID=5963 RepID=A0A1R2D1V6_9CILI|nr:hypothetical protein SteCoe_1397 [Stentor coeruleus]
MLYKLLFLLTSQNVLSSIINDSDSYDTSLPTEPKTTSFYNQGEDVIVWYNRGISPKSLSDSYSFYDIPFCRGSRSLDFPLSLSNILSGVTPLDSGMGIKFLVNSQPKEFCVKKLTSEDYSALVNTIILDLFAEFLIDEIPVWVRIGKVESGVQIFSTFHFTIHYNGDQIIKVHVQPDDPILLLDEKKHKKNTEITLAYSVSWVPTSLTYEKRMESYFESGIFSTEFHWFSLLNTTGLILSVCAIILGNLYRALRNDFKQFESAEIFDMQRGWKQLKKEIEAPPVLNFLISGLTGIGVELWVIFLTYLLTYSLNLSIKDILINLSISLSGLLGGTTTSKVFQNLKGLAATIVIAGCIFPSFLILISTIYLLSGVGISIWTYFASTINIFFFFFAAGYNRSQDTTKIVVGRSVCKKKPWYVEMNFLIIIGGLLPFVSIALELHSFLTTFMVYSFYYMYGFFIISTFQVAICLGCVGIVSSYLVISTEDSKWQWSSFLSGASLGIYVFFYSLYVYLFRNGFDGVLAFVVNMLFICFLLSIASGSASFLAAKVFLEKLYSRVKLE